MMKSNISQSIAQAAVKAALKAATKQGDTLRYENGEVISALEAATKERDSLSRSYEAFHEQMNAQVESLISQVSKQSLNDAVFNAKTLDPRK